ncbi:MAG: sodium/proline symporter PutP [Succinivibrionaceae bacterium]
MEISTTVTFIVYIVAMLLIGILATKYTKSLSDYILGGRRLGSFVTALSSGASDMSGWLLLGLPGALYLSGLCESWIAIGLTIGAWFNWKLVAGRLRVFTEISNNALTLPDYFTHRFHDQKRILSILTAIIILIFFVVYCAAGMVSSAKLFSQAFELDYQTGLYIGAVATIGYVMIGGFLAVSWTDTIQATLMIFALLVTPIVILVSLGGLDNVVAAVNSTNPTASNWFAGDFSLQTIVMLLTCLGWGLGYMGQPHILVRFMAANSVRAIPRARIISITWMILCLLGACSVGYFGIAYIAQHPELNAYVSNGGQENIFIVLSKYMFNPWISGILLSAILAAVMSTLSCQLLVSSSVLTEDLYHQYLRPKAGQRELVWCGRMMLLGVAVVAFILAQDPNAKVLDLVSWAWAGFGASFGPIVLISLFWKKMNFAGALAGMFTGAVTVIIWSIFKDQYFMGLYELIPGFLTNCLAIFIVSSLTQKCCHSCSDIYLKLKDEYRIRTQD